ncbi:basement membrane-specific heparan sulfate proteoglycan core protein-like isoform X1 [Pelodiscus sinensis]|uniref:basement membrane-specific heparan sulfate proteoglycan core protein-like isoform X1 n=1 Tax=Pelodiscus sinensis TaxID=13735 RepID=UPI003F6B088A
MLLSLCLLLTVINPSSQKICLAPGALPAPTLYLNQTSAQQGDSVRLKCSVVSQAPATRVFFCKDGEEILSETGLEKKITYNYDHAVSRGSSGNYSCGYEIQDSDNRVNRSQLSPAKHLSVTALGPSSKEICSAPGALPAPTLYLSQMSAQQGDSVRLKCSVVSQAPATRVVFCKDGEEILSETGLEKKVTYNYDHAVSMDSSGNYSCGYEIQDSDKWVTRSQLSLAKHLSVTALSPRSQEICSAPGALFAPTLYLSQTSAQQGDSVRLKCSVVSQAPATRIIFCKDGEEIMSETGLEKKITYDYDHAVSMGSSGSYSCGYEIQDSDNRVSRSQLSSAKHLSVTELHPSSPEICSAPGALPAPILQLSPTSARQRDFVLLKCSVISQARATRIVFCKNGEILSGTGLEENVTYDYNYTVTGDSSGNYSCGYEVKDSDNQVTRSQLSPGQSLSVTGGGSSSRGTEEPTHPGLTTSITIWAARCALVLLLFVSVPIITLVLEKWGQPKCRAGKDSQREHQHHGGERDGEMGKSM